MNFTETYRNKKIFLTGHTGFKGSWLLCWLHELGARVKGYSLAPQPGNELYNHIGGDGLCESVTGDIMDYGRLEESLLRFQPDFVFHLAAQALVRQSYQDPVGTFSVNAIGTAHVLNAVRKLEKPCTVVLVTTDKVYYNYEWSYPYRETDRLGGYDPYSASKACAELIIDSYRNSFFHPKDHAIHHKSVAAARAGNVIGGGDWARDRIIPDVVRALQAGESVSIRNPASVRPWQHVMEPLSAYLLLGSKLAGDPVKYATEYNFGPLTADCWHVEAMVEHAIAAWGSGRYHVADQTGMPHEAGLLKLDVSKAEAELQWKPVFSAGEAIDTTVRWYKSFNGSNARGLIMEDIRSYNNRMPA